MTIDVYFIDAGHRSDERPDPAFPTGRRVNIDGPLPTALCCYNLPYPAPRCGTYVVECLECPVRHEIPVNGRSDDPYIITMPCKKQLKLL